MTTQVIPSIYVACLAAYNAGILHGVTIDFYDGIDESDVERLIEEMIASSPFEDAGLPASLWLAFTTSISMKFYFPQLQLNGSSKLECISLCAEPKPSWYYELAI